MHTHSQTTHMTCATREDFSSNTLSYELFLFSFLYSIFCQEKPIKCVRRYRQSCICVCELIKMFEVFSTNSTGILMWSICLLLFDSFESNLDFYVPNSLWIDWNSSIFIATAIDLVSGEIWLINMMARGGIGALRMKSHKTDTEFTNMNHTSTISL